MNKRHLQQQLNTFPEASRHSLLAPVKSRILLLQSYCKGLMQPTVAFALFLSVYSLEIIAEIIPNQTGGSGAAISRTTSMSAMWFKCMHFIYWLNVSLTGRPLGPGAPGRPDSPSSPRAPIGPVKPSCPGWPGLPSAPVTPLWPFSPR